MNMDKVCEALARYLYEYEGVYDSVAEDGTQYQSEPAKAAEAAAREALSMQPAAELAKLRQWRDTIDDMLTVFHEVASDDPRESINRLINRHVQVVLDPAVSSDADALVEVGRQQGAKLRQGEPVAAERERISALLVAIREHWAKNNGEDSISVSALDQIAEVIADGSYVISATPSPTKGQTPDTPSAD